MKEDEQHVSFDGQALGKALGTRPATVHDVAYGEGQLFSAGHGTTRLEVFPRAGVTRLTATDLRVELFGTADATVSPTGVEFHRSQPDQQASFTVLPGGGMVFTFLAGAEPRAAGTEPAPPPGQGPQTAPKPVPEPASPPGQLPRTEAPSAPLTAPAGTAATESPTTRPTPVDTEPTPQSATEPALEPAGPPAPPPTREAPATPPPGRVEPSPTPPQAASPAAGDTKPEPRQTRPEQAPRVQLTGRLGRDPSFRTTTKTGTLVSRFPLAEHLDNGQTRWRTVLAFGDRAHQLQRRTQAGELAQGRQVDVVGYLHTNIRQGRDGRPRSVQEVYATAVTRH